MSDSLISQFKREYNAPIEEFRQVADITERDAISSSRRWIGMLVYVVSEQFTYELKGAIDNTAWTPLTGLDDAPSDGSEYVRKDGAWTIFVPPAAALPYLLFEATITTDPVTPVLNVHYDTTDGFTLTNPAVGVYTLTPVGAYLSANATFFANPVQVGTVEDELVKLTKGSSTLQVAFFKNGALSDSSNKIDVQIKLFTP